MGKSVRHSAEWYARALQGDKDNFGLREVARGFGSRDGFNLRDGLSAKQRKKVRSAFHELQEITAQSRHVYKPKNNSKGEQEKLRKAQRLVQEDTDTEWKVAFIPYAPRKLKNGKLSKPRITFGKEGIRIHDRGFIKITVPLDQERMATNAKGEIVRAIKMEAPRAQRFTIQAGANEMPVLSDRTGVVKRVMELQNRYDGVKALPLGSGNAGDKPEYHAWDLWLHNLVAYEFPKVSAKAVAQASNTFHDANAALRKKRKADRERARYQATHPAKRKRK